ncbi:MAG: hypothetical protein AB7O62_14225 [Pirellulales bacterium]
MPKPDAMPMDACPLTAAEQRRNLLLFGANIGLIYLGAPVLYVGLTQAALLQHLGASNTFANLPSSFYFWMTPLPILAAWWFHRSRQIKPVIAGCFLLAALGGLLVAGTLVFPTPAWAAAMLRGLNARLPEPLQVPIHWSAPVVLLHSALLGGVLVTVSAFQWVVIGKGVAESRRGKVLALAFGVGPLLAVASALACQLIFSGSLELPTLWQGHQPWRMEIAPLAFPGNFAVLFAATTPILGLAALLSMKFVLPPPDADEQAARESFFDGVLAGFGGFFSNRLILLASICLILVGSGYSIINNFTLSTSSVVAKGEKAEVNEVKEPEEPANDVKPPADKKPENATQYVGYQHAIRFAFKAVGGLLLGWLLSLTHPKAGMLVTAGFCLASVLWVQAVAGQWIAGVAGKWFLLSFGLIGIGELFGVYFPNYILSCSPKSQMRRNMSFTGMLNMPTAFAPLLFGLIADSVAAATEDPAAGFIASFWVAVTILCAALALVLVLPTRPEPSGE